MMETSGALYWQLNDCWPVCSWSAADYRRRPKALWYYSRRFFAPLALRVDELDDGVSVWVINDSASSARGHLSIRVMDFTGREKSSMEKTVRVGAGEVVRIGPFSRKELSVTDESGEFVHTVFKPDGSSAVEETGFFARPKSLKLPDPGLDVKVRRSGRRLGAEITSKRLAYGVWLALKNHPAAFSDNFFTLIPGATRRVTISGTDLSAAAASRLLAVKYAEGGL